MTQYVSRLQGLRYPIEILEPSPTLAFANDVLFTVRTAIQVHDRLSLLEIVQHAKAIPLFWVRYFLIFLHLQLKNSKKFAYY